MSALAPGSFVVGRDVWAPFEEAVERLPSECVVLVDARVAQLHPHVARALAKRRDALVQLVRAGESAKSFRMLERLSGLGQQLSRRGTVVAIGGGTIGDVATVLAHLVKRGVKLIHVPTTLLAAVDSSVGGKGALNVTGTKNALGVFHSAHESWLCEELFSTLSTAQLREGMSEAVKMAVCLDRARFEAWETSRGFSLKEIIQASRAIKNAVCTSDPYEQLGRRVVLNFGHTFGHVIESVTRFRVRHGEAVALGMLCALDLGVMTQTTPVTIAQRLERVLVTRRLASRERLSSVLQRVDAAHVEQLLSHDKKRIATGSLNLVAVAGAGKWTTVPVPHAMWKRALARWR